MRAIMFLLGGTLLAACTTPSGPPPDDFAARCAQYGTWAPLPATELPGRINAAAVWSGREMIVWGGTQGAEAPLGDGAAYDPARGSWRGLGAARAPVARDGHVVVWTGEELIVWGGNGYSERWDAFDDGGRYAPADGAGGAWETLASSRLRERDDARGVWTGAEMIVWGGRTGREHLGDGGRFDPRAGRWRPVSTAGAPEPREDHTAIWTGTEMIVWGGWRGPSDQRDYALGGGRYDPAADTWRPISRRGAPEPREDHTAIWTGTEMIVWGGVARDGDPPIRRRLGTGGRYDPATDTWRELSMVDAPSPREDNVAVWTGDELIVWGGRDKSILLRDAARYSPEHDAWCPVAHLGGPAAARDAVAVWTGTEMLVWGGDRGEGAGLDLALRGGAYTPPAAR